MSATKPMFTTAGAVAFDPPLAVAAGELEALEAPEELDGLELDDPEDFEELEQAASANAALAAMATRARVRDTRTPWFSGGTSMEDGPAVDTDGLTGQVGGARCAQPGDQLADVVGGAETPGWYGGQV
jgi:hypothetical protein